jgi:hypothetical protein
VGSFEPKCELCGNTEAHIYANVGGSLSCCLTKLARLETECKVEGWDSYGAEAITPQALETARRLVSHFCGQHIGPKCIVPTNKGGIDFTWPLRGDSEGVTLSIDPSGMDESVGLWSPDGEALIALLTDGVRSLTEIVLKRE